jgi:hypothetical protein
VDPDRLAYAGYSYGGAMSGLLAGVEERLQALALTVGNGGVVAHRAGFKNLFWKTYPPSDERTRWIATMWPLEPLHFVGHAAPAALLFQNGTRDALVAPADALCYQQAGSEPKQVKWYDTGHGLPVQALQDQLEWLQDHIGIDVDKFRFDRLDVEVEADPLDAIDKEQVLKQYIEAAEREPDNVWHLGMLCWYGSLAGRAADVMYACERGVELDPDNPVIRDSRGLARALMGDYAGAIEDFEFYVACARRDKVYEQNLGFKRDAWIVELEAGRNPFDEATLEELWNE